MSKLAYHGDRKKMSTISGLSFLDSLQTLRLSFNIALRGPWKKLFFHRLFQYLSYTFWFWRGVVRCASTEALQKWPYGVTKLICYEIRNSTDSEYFRKHRKNCLKKWLLFWLFQGKWQLVFTFSPIRRTLTLPLVPVLASQTSANESSAAAKIIYYEMPERNYDRNQLSVPVH